MNRLARSPLTFSLGVAALLCTPGARASEIDVCLEAVDRAQPLRSEGSFRAARRQLDICARPICPAPVRAQCKRWASEVDVEQPSIVFRAQDTNGQRVDGLRVFVDDEIVPEAPSGSAWPADAREHVVRFEAAGQTQVERVTLKRGEKAHVVAVTFTAPPPKPVVVSPPEGGTRETPRPRSKIPTVSFVLGGIGLAALGGATVMYVIGLHDGFALEDGCGKTHSCSATSRDAVRTKLIIGDVAAGAGLVLFGAAVWTMLAADKTTAGATPPTIDVAPTIGGAIFTASGSL